MSSRIKNEETGEMPEKILKDFFKAGGNKAVIKQSQTRIQERKVKRDMSRKEKVNWYTNQEFEEGELARVQLSNFQSAIREQIEPLFGHTICTQSSKKL